MALRKLELLSLEDRCVPAVLAAYSPVTESTPTESTTYVAAAAASKIVLASQADTASGTTLGKLAANHNQTLVRMRRCG